MNLNEFAKEVHENAVAHGWWETDRSFAECVVLIHSEWSEALEEARAGRPMKWYYTNYNDDDCGGGGRCSAVVDMGGVCHGAKFRGGICYLNHKPEGIAVELIDGVIRILDLCGRYGYKLKTETLDLLIEDFDGSISANTLRGDNDNLPRVILFLHYMTSMAGMCMFETEAVKLAFPILERCAGIAIWWVHQHELDPEKLLREKHQYNKTRPYKHGKKF